MSALRAPAPTGHYDLVGDATLTSVGALRPATPSGRIAAGEARMATARAATDLWLISFLDAEHDDLEVRLSTAMGVPRAAMAGALMHEVIEAGNGRGTQAVDELVTAIELRRALAEHGTGVSFAGTRGLRRDALLVDAVARAIASRDQRALVATIGDPCAGAVPCEAPWSAWAAASRAEIAAVAEASAAAWRLERAVDAGDPFARAVIESMREPSAAIAAHVVRPIPRTPLDMPITASPEEGSALRADVIIAVAAEEIRVTRVSPVRISHGRIEQVETGDDVNPASAIVPVRRAPSDRDSIDGLVQHVRGLRLADDAVIAVAVAPDVPAARLARVLASLADADRAPSMLVRRVADGSLRGVSIRLVDRDGVGAAGDLVVTPQAEGFAITNAGAETLLTPNEESLATRLGVHPGRRLVLDAAADGSASDFVSAAFRLGRGGSTITLVGR